MNDWLEIKADLIRHRSHVGLPVIKCEELQVGSSFFVKDVRVDDVYVTFGVILILEEADRLITDDRITVLFNGNIKLWHSSWCRMYFEKL